MIGRNAGTEVEYRRFGIDLVAHGGGEPFAQTPSAIGLTERFQRGHRAGDTLLA